MAREWGRYAARERELFESGEDYISDFRTGEGVQRLSSMLEVLDALGESEQVRRRERAEHASLTGRLLFWLSLGCVTSLALVLGYASRRQLLALARSHDAAVAAMQEREQRIRELNASLEQRVADRTQALAAVNAELEAFTSSVSHDLRAPLRQLGGFTRLLGESAGTRLDARERSYLALLRSTAAEAVQMVDDLLSFSRVSRAELRSRAVDLNAVLGSARDGLLHEEEGREVEWVVHTLPTVQGDPTMLLLVLRNLLGNALKYSRKRRPARIEVGHGERAGRRGHRLRPRQRRWLRHEVRPQALRGVPAPAPGRRVRGHRHRSGARAAHRPEARGTGLGGWRPGPGRNVLRGTSASGAAGRDRALSRLGRWPVPRMVR